MAKALVVDDSRAVRMILARTLKELGLKFAKPPTEEKLWK